MVEKGGRNSSEFPLLQRGQGNFELMLDLKACPKRPQSVAAKEIPEPVAGFSMGTVLTILKNCFKWKSSDKYWETFPNKTVATLECTSFLMLSRFFM